MPTINPTLPNDGETIDASDISGPIQAILSVINGNIDQSNISLGSMTWAIMGTVSNAIPVDAMVDAGNLRISRDETMWDHVASGLVITADAAGSTLLWSMTGGTVYINGRRLLVSALNNIAATASKDTYVDIIDNLDGTASVVRTGGNIVANNAASPALAANSIRIGIVVSGASNIAAAASINQGQEDRVLPIASSVAYTVSDSLGNMICNRSPSPSLIGYRRYAINFSTAATTATQITGLSCPVIVPTNRKISAKVQVPSLYNGTSGSQARLGVWRGTPNSGTRLGEGLALSGAGAIGALPASIEGIDTPPSNSQTYNASLHASANTANADNSVSFAYIEVRMA